MHNTQLTFIRQGTRGVENLLVLGIDSEQPLTRETAMTALRNGLSAWAKTPDGLKAWDHSCEDYNVGDFLGDMDHPDLVALLKAEGIVKVDVVFELETGTFTYDKILIHDPRME